MGWLYLMTCHVVLGQALADEQHQGPWQLSIHVPLHDGQDTCASPWMRKFARRATVSSVGVCTRQRSRHCSVQGDIGNHHLNATLVDKDAAAEEDLERSVFDLSASSLNVALEWTREIRTCILDTVKVCRSPPNGGYRTPDKHTGPRRSGAAGGHEAARGREPGVRRLRPEPHAVGVHHAGRVPVRQLQVRLLLLSSPLFCCVVHRHVAHLWPGPCTRSIWATKVCCAPWPSSGTSPPSSGGTWTRS